MFGRLSRPRAAVAILLFAVARPSGRAEGPREASDLLASTVCILGDLREGKLASSGFVVPPGDQVMTTAHGLAHATNLRAKLYDGRVVPAHLERLGSEETDVALLGLDGARLRPVALGTVETLDVGDEVSTVGCPLGFEFSLSRGVVSAVRTSDLGYPLIQTDVPVNPGSSGGPLFDRQGRVVGIVKGTVAKGERIHFALPVDLGKAFLDERMAEQRAYEIFNQAVLEPRLEEKVPLYRQSIALAPDFAEPHYNLALALERLERPSEAAEEYRKTLALLPDYEPAALNLGALLYQQKRLDQAIDLYRASLERTPGSVRLRNNLAEAYRASGEAERARREFERILKEKSDYAPAHYGLAVLYDDQLDDPERAADHYRRYLALAPEAADADRVREWLERIEEKK